MALRSWDLKVQTVEMTLPVPICYLGVGKKTPMSISGSCAPLWPPHTYPTPLFHSLGCSCPGLQKVTFLSLSTVHLLRHNSEFYLQFSKNCCDFPYHPVHTGKHFQRAALLSSHTPFRHRYHSGWLRAHKTTVTRNLTENRFYSAFSAERESLLTRHDKSYGW